MGPTFELVFVSGDDNKLVVPQLLTRHGLGLFCVKQRDALVELDRDGFLRCWNITRSVKYSDADRAEIQRQLTEQYLSDYTATWRAGMDNLNVRDYESIAQLTGALEQIISGDQPLQRALTAPARQHSRHHTARKLDDKEARRGPERAGLPASDAPRPRIRVGKQYAGSAKDKKVPSGRSTGN